MRGDGHEQSSHATADGAELTFLWVRSHLDLSITPVGEAHIGENHCLACPKLLVPVDVARGTVSRLSRRFACRDSDFAPGRGSPAPVVR